MGKEQRPCDHCGGSGTVPLEPYYLEVLDLIRISAKVPAFIADKLGLAGSTVNMRLKRLCEWGLVERGSAVTLDGGGRTFLYRKAIPTHDARTTSGWGPESPTVGLVQREPTLAEIKDEL